MSADNGSASVVADAVSGVAAGIASVRSAAAGEQIEAFELPTRQPADGGAIERATEQIRKRGRPPGAVNKSTKEMRDYLLRRGINPLESMMRWAMHTPESLAAELGCSALEAFDRLAGLWRELGPYFASKMVPVDDEGKPVPFFTMSVGQVGVIAPSSGAEPPWVTALRQIEHDQGLSAPLAKVSHGDVSHEREKAR